MDSDFADLLAANAGFAETFDLAGFDGVAHSGVAVVTCMDSRIDPLRMLGSSRAMRSSSAIPAATSPIPHSTPWCWEFTCWVSSGS